jgi:hypothetical protein
MSKDKKENQNSENLRTILKNRWVINFNNTSDIGYPDTEYYNSNEKED